MRPAWPFTVVEFYQVQRRLPPPSSEGCPDWLDIPDARRADEGEAFDLADELRRAEPAAEFRVVRRWR